MRRRPRPHAPRRANVPLRRAAHDPALQLRVPGAPAALLAAPQPGRQRDRLRPHGLLLRAVLCHGHESVGQDYPAQGAVYGTR